MTKKAALFIGLMASIVSGAQTADSAYLKVVYELTYKPDSTKKNNFKTEGFSLLVGKRSSIFFSQTKFLRDSALNKNIKEGTVEAFMRSATTRDQFGAVGFYSDINILRNYSNDAFNVVDQTIGGDSFYYIDKLPQFNWQISEDTMTIADQKCQKATGSFRGRNYIAWFSNQVAVNAGPYKFYGLPGLIVKISDTGNNYSYTLEGIEQLSFKKAIVLNTASAIQATRKEFIRVQKHSFDNPWESLKNNGVTVTLSQSKPVGKNQTVGASSGGKIPYNPIELE